MDLREVAPGRREAFERAVESGTRRTFVLGRNKYAQSVANGIEVAGFVDDVTPEREYLGKPVLRMTELPPECTVVSCVVDGRPVTAVRRLRERGVREVFDYFTLLRLWPGRFRPLDFSAHNESDLTENRAKYDWLDGRLADEASRRVLRQVMQFRLTGDLDAMTGFVVDLDRQYFENFVRLDEGAVFVDGGGFDGQTTKKFAARYPKYERIYYFEPSPTMMADSETALGNLRSVVRVQKALSSSTGHVRFDATGGSTSAISDAGDIEVACARLDDEVSEHVSFIKLDIEGAEFDALAGARHRITTDVPTMAICVYHDQRDFWRIPERVLSYVDDYDIYLRHYTEGILETVMYFIPGESRDGNRH